MNIRILAPLTLLLLFAAPLRAKPVEKKGDGDIRLAVTREIRQDDGVPGHRVDVVSSEGIVTLRGTVHNVLARDRAETVALAIKGVRAVVNEIEVAPVSRTDAEILKDIEIALTVDPAADAYEVTPTVEQGLVTLEGVVESWQEKRSAETAALGVRGVTDVINLISIDFHAERLDHEIAKDVERRLELDVRIDAYGIDVTVENGHVALSGVVGSALEKRQAKFDAWVQGTTAVDVSGLDVAPWAADAMIRRNTPLPSDDEIKKAVKEAFVLDRRVFSVAPEVRVANGRVSLLGEVESLEAKRAADETARNTAGVRRVDNFLMVNPPKRTEDAELADRIGHALLRDPYVDRFEIEVAVLNGKVTLYGDVDTWFEKSRAGLIASFVAGVTDLQNKLSVRDVWEWQPDALILRDIETELYWTPFVDHEDVSVSVEDGVATLTGSVDTWRALRTAVQEAREGGARSVRCRLRVRGQKRK